MKRKMIILLIIISLFTVFIFTSCNKSKSQKTNIYEANYTEKIKNDSILNNFDNNTKENILFESIIINRNEMSYNMAPYLRTDLEQIIPQNNINFLVENIKKSIDSDNKEILEYEIILETEKNKESIISPTIILKEELTPTPIPTTTIAPISTSSSTPEPTSTLNIINNTENDSKQEKEKCIISLLVPDYKQRDNRWANVKLGNSSDTIYKSGCLTTAIAMEKSYFYEKEITPDVIANTAKYTSTGLYCWTDEYTTIFKKDLNKFKKLLIKNTPVIVAAKNSYSEQHWVIITGYKENGSVTADDFILNDPGSTKILTLNAFFDKYPNFYKAVYRP